jgi:hypothetical protein
MKTNRPGFGTFALLSSLLLPLVPGASRAQSVGADLGGALSGYREIDGALALDVSLTIPTGLGFELLARAGETVGLKEWERSVCSGFIQPGQDCPTAVFQGDFFLTSLGLGVLVNQRLGPRTDLFFGGDLSRYWISGEWKSGDYRVGPMPSRPGSGWGVLVGVYRRIWANSGVRVTLRRETPDFAACGADAYFPFCQREPVTSLKVGIQRRVRR